MRTLDRRPKVSRRALLTGSGAAVLAVSIGPDGLVSGRAWAAQPAAVTPETFATLVQVSRDIYPHDRFADSIYAEAVKEIDASAAGDDKTTKLLEDGVAALNSAAQGAHGSAYNAVEWESDRVALLRAIETGPFFQKIRGALITGIYNKPRVWELLGYEGESASKGGYINRGFDDLDWI
ncbi:MAG: gluconate 2-dehydrogenase subunit 3 family protein [Hyphomicrobiaceae bacterium]